MPDAAFFKHIPVVVDMVSDAPITSRFADPKEDPAAFAFKFGPETADAQARDGIIPQNTEEGIGEGIDLDFDSTRGVSRAG